MADGWHFQLVDALDKVFPDEAPRGRASADLTAFLGEPIAFQVAIRAPSGVDRVDDAVRIEVVAADASVDIRSVELVPCRLVGYPGHDDGYLRDTPGLYPDLLAPADDRIVQPFVWGWRGVWIELVPMAPGRAPVTIRVRHARRGELLYETALVVDVLDAVLPELDIVDSHWLHADAIADAYRVEVFSEAHWAAVEHFVASASRMRANSLLVPVWTPPIDTEPGHRRRAVQLIDVAVDGDRFGFGFSRLDRWLDVLRRHGIRHIEIPHLFTQWGAAAAPAIDGVVEGGLTQLFGWHTPATAPGYRTFLEQLLPALRRHLDSVWDPARVVYHVSDEPAPEHEAQYRAARAVVADLLAGARVMDAVSDVRYVENGLVDRPIAATDQVEQFLEARVPELWVYYCLTQHRDVANRFIGMPSARHRVLGSQVFAAGVSGLLHWGFNFYYSARARRFVDPFVDASADGTMPAGDPFIVYPGPGLRPLESIRHRVAAQSMDDHRALQAVRTAAGWQAALGTLGPAGRTFRSPLVSTTDLRAQRDRVHAVIREVGRG